MPDAIQALTAAANIGGTEAILAGRPGSWEAEKVRQVLQSTVGGNDDYLWSHRTEPITITINVANILDYGPAQQQYETAEADIERQREALGLPIVTGAPDDPDRAQPRCRAPRAHSGQEDLYLLSRVFAAEAGLRLPHHAVAFVLAHPAITAVLIGPRRPEHLADLLAGAEVELSEDVLDRTDEIVPPSVDVNPGDLYIDPSPAIADKRRRRR